MLIRNSEIKKLSDDIRKIIDGQTVDLRDNREGAWGILKNDIHTLATLKSEQVTMKHQPENGTKRPPTHKPVTKPGY